MTANRLQLPLAVTKYGPIKSISYPDTIVKNGNTITIKKSRKDVADDTATEDGENVSQLFTNTMHKGHYMVLNKTKKASLSTCFYTSERIRTFDLLVRSQLLYPAELRTHIRCLISNENYYSITIVFCQVFF